MSADSPTVSIVIGVFNGGAGLRTTVESIRAQTFEDFEVVLVDDASTDDTGEYMDELAAENPRFRVFHFSENRGLTAALIRGCREARGEFIARIDSDDWMVPDRLARQVEFLRAHEDVGILGSALTVHYDVDERVFERTDTPPAQTDEQIRRRLRFRNVFGHVSVMFRRTDYERAGGYNPSFYYSQDFELWPKLLRVTRGHNLTEPLTHCRFADRSISIMHNNGQLLSVARVQWRNIRWGLAPWWSVFWILRLLVFAALPYKLRSRLRFLLHGIRTRQKKT